MHRRIRPAARGLRAPDNRCIGLFISLSHAVASPATDPACAVGPDLLNVRIRWPIFRLSVVTLDELDGLLLQPVQKLVRPVERRRHGAALDETVLY